jgi:hypothetical protein
MNNKTETINIQLRKDHAWKLVRFLGAQDIEDTKDTIDKYKLHMNEEEMEAILQHLFNQLSCELGLEA